MTEREMTLSAEQVEIWRHQLTERYINEDNKAELNKLCDMALSTLGDAREPAVGDIQPVAWMYEEPERMNMGPVFRKDRAPSLPSGWTETPLYLTAPPRSAAGVAIELGCAGHHICADRCRFRRHTQVNGYRISTVGDLYIDDKRETIGGSGYFETYIFKTTGEPCKGNDGCGCIQVADWCEIDGERYETAGEAQAGHEAYVAKYATASSPGAGGEAEQHWADKKLPHEWPCTMAPIAADAQNAGREDDLRTALINHRLEADKPSQLADSFRNGWNAAKNSAASAPSASAAAWKSASDVAPIIKRLMADVGMPDSQSLYTAFWQLANEMNQLPPAAAPGGGVDEWLAAAHFAGYMHANYHDGVILSNVAWHIPKIWRAAKYALAQPRKEQKA
jgi:hypothetical protein